MSQASIYKVGEIVKLKSGGPDMTVKNINKHFRDDTFSGTYDCQWFAGKKLDTGTFPQDSLVKVEPKVNQ